MALNPNKDLKKYYSIQEVAKMYNVSESLLRFWETEFPQLKPRRAGRDIRQYSKDDVKLVGVIHDLVKRRGLKLSAARDVLRKNKEGAYRSNEAIDTLKAIRAQLVELRKNLGGIVADHEYELAES
ncbi:MAG: MerR family transcriptional regulator [Bacteroidaceae bacterium]|jgi:DNA-binding transcriptional MerR regulator|nr:MerR family transcriptional regulator [Bacteroidaceae bacterium]MBR3734077.1 MerR family transcriptional regulator [Bacteroidaceae bacterium]